MINNHQYIGIIYMLYHLQHDDWLLLWKKITIENNSSMSLERLLNCRQFDFDGLTHSVHVHHNSATASSRKSTLLFLFAWKYCDADRIKRGRDWAKAPQIRLP